MEYKVLFGDFLHFISNLLRFVYSSRLNEAEAKYFQLVLVYIHFIIFVLSTNPSMEELIIRIVLVEPSPNRVVLTLQVPFFSRYCIFNLSSDFCIRIVSKDKFFLDSLQGVVVLENVM